MNMKQWLKDQQSQYDAQAAEAKANPGGGFWNPEDGKYVTILISAEIVESKSSGNPQVVWEHKIVESVIASDIGKTFKTFDQLMTERGFEFLSRKFILWGIDPTTVSLVTMQEKVLDKIVDMQRYLRVTLKTKDEFQNCYINKVMDGYIPQTGVVTGGNGQEYNPFENDSLEAQPGMKLFYKTDPADEEEIEGIIVKVNEDSLVVKSGKKNVEITSLQVVRVEAAEEPAAT